MPEKTDPNVPHWMKKQHSTHATMFNSMINDKDEVPSRNKKKTDPPSWLTKIPEKNTIIIEIQNIGELLSCFIQLCQHQSKNYIFIFKDLDRMMRYLINHINVLTSENLAIYGYDYLSYVYPYLIFNTSFDEYPKNKLTVVTTYDKIKHKKFNIYSCVYDHFSSHSYGNENIFFTLERHHTDAIRTFDIEKHLRQYRCIIVYDMDQRNMIFDLMLKYNHKRVVLFYQPEDILVNFPVSLSQYKKIDYDSDLEDDHIKNQNKMPLQLLPSEEYAGYQDGIVIFMDGQQIDNLGEKKELYIFYKYNQDDLCNLLLKGDTKTSIDVAFIYDNQYRIFEDIRRFRPSKVIHFSNTHKNESIIKEVMTKLE
jgi:hypothetical protein